LKIDQINSAVTDMTRTISSDRTQQPKVLSQLHDLLVMQLAASIGEQDGFCEIAMSRTQRLTENF
jgi:hypothetical protein